MMRQYFTSPFQGGDNPLRVGTIAVGSIYYLQSDAWWRDRFRGKPQTREPWMVEAFLNGVMGAARRDPATGHWRSLFIAGRSDLAVVRSLRASGRKVVAVRILHAHEEEGLYRVCPVYPVLPSAEAIERYYASKRRRAA